MAVGKSDMRNGVVNMIKELKKHPTQFLLAIFLVMCCGATKKFQTFPMPYIAGQSKCEKVIEEQPWFKVHPFRGEPGGKKWYMPRSFKVTETVGCEEKAKVFLFVNESFTITTANLVFFGLVKAVFNFVTGVCCDRWGRKYTLIVGWILAIPMPLMVILAKNWWVVAFSNIFLGMQQALVWSATIFIMIDYLGQNNSGIAIGLNETIGYTTIAIVTIISAAILDEESPREANYYVVLGLIGINIIVGLLALKESKPVAVKEEATRTDRNENEVVTSTTTTLRWPSGRSMQISVARSAFVYTSFINISLMSICFAGLMINFISGFAWGLFAKWMKNDYEVDGETKWLALSKTAVANITLCYGLPKGVLQFIFGFVGDRCGRKWLIAGGLFTCSFGLLVLAITGEVSSDPTVGFVIGALLLGTGTGIMYTNNLAAVVDHSDPTWRSSALGSYRFWRDLGWAVGALSTGLWSDAIGTLGSVVMTAVLTIVAATCVSVFYHEVNPEAKEVPVMVDV